MRGTKERPQPRDGRDDLDYEDEPDVAPTPLWKRKGVLLLVGAGVVVILFIFTRGPTPVIQTASQDQMIGVTHPYEAPSVKTAAPASIVPPAAPPAPPQVPIPDFTKAGGNQPQTPPPAARPSMVYYPVHIDPPAAADKEEKESAEPAKTKLKFAAKELPGTKASPAIDSTYMLMPGLLLCVLDVAIDSNLPGPLQCHLPGPAYSRKGVTLMEDQTQVFGAYESMKQNGVERLQATSAFAVTPNDIWVPLAGDPFADPLGRSGMSGTIDKRMLERFGGAVLLDLSQNALQIAQSSVSKGGSTYLSFNGADQLASQILQSTINLPPIFTKSQGSMIAIWIKEPVSFHDSYKITTR